MAKIRIALFAALLVTSSIHADEAQWTAKWCGEQGMIYDVQGDGTRPGELELQTPTGRTVIADCMGTRYAVEIDFAHKYAEGITQSLLYSRLARREALLALIVESEGDCKYYFDARWLIWETNQRIALATIGGVCER